MSDANDVSQTNDMAAYQAVIEDLCQRFAIENPQSVAAGGMIDISGVHLAITLNQLVPQSPSVSIYVDVGPPPRSGEAVVLRMLLQQNFANSATRGLVYSVSPATGRVVGVMHVGLAGLEGSGLESLVNMLVDLTLEWRESYFLWSPSSSEAGNSAPFTGAGKGSFG